MSQERIRFPIQPQNIHLSAGSSGRIHADAGQQGRDRAAQLRERSRRETTKRRRKGGGR